MTFKTKMLACVSALLMTTSLNAYAQTPAPAVPDPAASQPAKPLEPTHVMAIVDGKNVTVAELDKMAQSLDPNLAKMPDEQRRLTTLRIYVDTMALSKAALEAKLDKTPDFDERMALARDNVLQQLYFQKEIMDKVSDSELKARYDKEIAAMPKQEELHARHILVKTKEEAEKIIQQLNKGAKFEDLAKSNSQDGSSAVGGDLGYFTKGEMVEPFEKAAFALKVGEYTKQPVETPFGWHIIKLEDRRAKQPPAFDDVKDTLKSMVVRDRYQQVIGDLRTKLAPQYPDENIAKAIAAPESNDALPGEASEDEE